MKKISSLEIVILAAGDGKRMKSSLPKVLHPIAGKPMLVHVIETALSLNPKQVHIVCGTHTERIQKEVEKWINQPIHWVYQEKPLGTGHAVQCALKFINLTDFLDSRLLVLFGDVPLISTQTLSNLISDTQENALGLLLVNLPDPFGFGRILRDQTSKILGIIEEKDATPTQRKIQEIFPGILLANAHALNTWLQKTNNQNAQSEYYLTDVVSMASQEGTDVVGVHTPHLFEVQGVNNRIQLAELERVYQEQLAHRWLLDGVQIMDPKRIDIRGEFSCGEDTVIDINVIFEGKNNIGKNCFIGAGCVIKNSLIADNVTIHPLSILEDAQVGSDSEIGPYARLRPGTILKERVKIGNFVETKKIDMGPNSKASHLSYLGDAQIGEAVNIGAGTITCNYDGVNKYKTIIEDGAFIGSDTQLIAPVRVGKNATLGAGTTLRKDAPDEQLTLSDSRQKSIAGWKRPSKKTSLKGKDH